LDINKTSEYWGGWQKSRVLFLIDLFGEEFFKGKRILELGAYNGWIGDCFYRLGADVTCIEGRSKNVHKIQHTYPYLKTHCANLDVKDWEWGKFDIIINFGLIYHLEKYNKEHIINCINNCNLLFLESVIWDKDESDIHYHREAGEDQSLSDRGGYPTTNYVEDIFKECGVKYTKYTTSKLNSLPHVYDWEDKNTKELEFGKRRFWIIERN